MQILLSEMKGSLIPTIEVFCFFENIKTQKQREFSITLTRWFCNKYQLITNINT